MTISIFHHKEEEEVVVSSGTSKTTAVFREQPNLKQKKKCVKEEVMMKFANNVRFSLEVKGTGVTQASQSELQSNRFL